MPSILGGRPGPPFRARMASSSPSARKRLRVRATVAGLHPRAAEMRSSSQAGPSSAASVSSSVRACWMVRAWERPVRVIASRAARWSSERTTMNLAGMAVEQVCLNLAVIA